MLDRILVFEFLKLITEGPYVDLGGLARGLLLPGTTNESGKES